MIRDRPVCPSCRKHFKPASVSKPVGYATCRVCRKHRFAFGQDGEGRPICEACSLNDRTDEVREKDEAYWKSALLKKAKLAAVELDQEWVCHLWLSFVAAESAAGNAKPVALKVGHYVQFFARLDAGVESLQGINGRALCACFSGDELRRYHKPLAFLSACSIEIPTQEQKVHAIEEARIRRILAEASGSRHEVLVTAFAGELCQGMDESCYPNLKTVRLSLRPALGLVGVAGPAAIAQEHLDSYLREHSGQAASISKFVTYLRRKGIELKLPPKAAAGKPRKKGSMAPVDKWLQGATSSTLGEAAAATIALLMHSYGVAQQALLDIPRAAATFRGGTISLDLGPVSVDLDPVLAHALTAYLHTRDTKFGDQGHLFPGRHASQSASEAGVAYHLARWGTSASSIARPARRALKVHADAES